MKYKDERVLTQVRIQVRRQLAWIRRFVGLPDRGDARAAEDLSRMLGETLARMAPEERRLIRSKAAVALAEIDALKESLVGHQHSIADELRQMRSHSTAVGAYRQTQRAAVQPGRR